MSTHDGRERPLVPLIVCGVTLLSVAVLLLWDALPHLFPARAHDFLASLPLVLIAATVLIYEVLRRPVRSEVVKAILLAFAFLFWAANQFAPSLRQAILFNDIAIGLFVFDVFLAIISRPATIS